MENWKNFPYPKYNFFKFDDKKHLQKNCIAVTQPWTPPLIKNYTPYLLDLFILDGIKKVKWHFSSCSPKATWPLNISCHFLAPAAFWPYQMIRFSAILANRSGGDPLVVKWSGVENCNPKAQVAMVIN